MSKNYKYGYRAHADGLPLQQIRVDDLGNVEFASLGSTDFEISQLVEHGGDL